MRAVSGSSTRTSGIALIAALGLLAVASAVMALLFARTMDDIRHGQDDTAIVQTLLVAQGGANMGVALLQNDVRYALDEIASEQSDTVGSWSFGSSFVDDDQPTASSVVADLDPVSADLQEAIDDLLCGSRDLGEGVDLTLRIHVTDSACGEALPDGTKLGDPRFVIGERREKGGNQRYALPFVMVSDGVQGEYRRRVVTEGEYLFVVGRRSFARYALFTDRHVGETGSAVWFTEDTLFDGPVHTNGNFRFSNSPWFGGAVSSSGANGGRGPGGWGYGDRFFDAGELEPGGTSPNLDNSGNRNRPEFDDGVDWRATEIDLPDNAFDQEELAKEDGIYFDEDLDRLELFAAGSDGEPIEGGEEATYQYVRATEEDGDVITYRIDEDGLLERYQGGELNTWQTVTDEFNGLVYAEEEVDRLEGPDRSDYNDPDTAPPAVASFAQLTLVPEEGARITGDLTYESPPCDGSLERVGSEIRRANCENLNAQNVLGIFVPQGNLEIGNNDWSSLRAPPDVRIQASLMTSNGVVRVENYDDTGLGTRGSVELLGGIIEEEYGAFGTFRRGSGMQSGYSRKFTFDPRMARGLTPPYFPTVGIDEVTDAQPITFGRREQVY